MAIANTPKASTRSTIAAGQGGCVQSPKTRTAPGVLNKPDPVTADQAQAKLDAKQSGQLIQDCMVRPKRRQHCGLPRRRGEDIFGRDKSVQESIGRNIKGIIVDGDEMYKTINEGISDKDGQGAGREYRDLKKFADNNWARMTPQAKQVFRAYERQVMGARAEGKTGLSEGRVDAFRTEAFFEKHDLFQGYKDASVGGAMRGLSMQRGTISGQDLFNALGSTRDADGQAFGREFDDVAQFADQNWHRMDPGARAVFKIYEREANAARSQGRTGARLADIRRIAGEMQGKLFLLGLGEMARYQSIRG